jgi:RNA polymerase sigma-70 factor (ECF subfamily)
LQDEYRAKGRGELFERLKFVLTGDSDGPAYAALAVELGVTEGAVKVAAHRLRRRYRDVLREEIAHTVADPEEVDDELGRLLAALRGEAY